jgi:hypothetical protein
LLEYRGVVASDPDYYLRGLADPWYRQYPVASPTAAAVETIPFESKCYGYESRDLPALLFDSLNALRTPIPTKSPA